MENNNNNNSLKHHSFTDLKKKPSWLHSMQLQKSQKWRYLSASEFEDEDLNIFHQLFGSNLRYQFVGQQPTKPMAEESNKNVKSSERQVDILVLVTWVDLVLQKL